MHSGLHPPTRVTSATRSHTSSGRAATTSSAAAVSPVTSSIKYFRDEYLQHQKEGGCPFDPAASTLFGRQ